MKVEELKEKARRHEMKEEWQKAFDLYATALRSHDEDEPPDITLYNRVGDIQTRLGQINGAVEHYEKAIELYLEAELPNNAIAICKKVLRNLPERNVFFLRMGQIRAGQGFLTDARQSFLTYAERQTTVGDIESALNALVEFVEISPEDVEIRQGLASQLEAHERTEEAVQQYAEIHRRLVVAGESEKAEEISEKLAELSPGFVLPDPEALLEEVAKPESEEMVLESTSLGGMELPAWGEGSDGFEGVEIDLGDAKDLEVEEAGEGSEIGSGLEFGTLELDGDLLQDSPQIPEGADEMEEEVSLIDGAVAGSEGAAEIEDDPEAEDDVLPSFEFESAEAAEEVEVIMAFGSDDTEPTELDVADAGAEDPAMEDEAPLGSGSVVLDPDGLDVDEPGPGGIESVGFGADDESLPLIGFDDDDDAELDGEMDDEALGDLGFQVSDGLDLDEDDSLPLLGFDDEDEEREEGVIEGVIEGEAPMEEEAASEPEEEAVVAEGSTLESALEGAIEDASFESGLEEEVEEVLVEADQGVEEELEEEAELAVEDMDSSALPGSHEDAASQGEMELAIQRVKASIEEEPENVQLHQRLVEYAFRTNDQEVLVSAYLQLAGCLASTDAPLKAKAVYQQVLALSPGHEGATTGIQGLDAVFGEPQAEVASSEEYVDLGSMILGDDAEESTRWTVAAEAPSGDDEADFAKMLGQFKDKVSEHVAVDDVSAHHDLGTAYMEMGLFEEAIGEYQMALRASPSHLPTHEVMGRCWMEMGKPDMAIRALNRALDVGYEVEDELIGIYYLMGRAQEDQGNNEEALEFYEKVFSLDINFEDVTERLRALR